MDLRQGMSWYHGLIFRHFLLSPLFFLFIVFPLSTFVSPSLFPPLSLFSQFATKAISWLHACCANFSHSPSIWRASQEHLRFQSVIHFVSLEHHLFQRSVLMYWTLLVASFLPWGPFSNHSLQCCLQLYPISADSISRYVASDWKGLITTYRALINVVN